jgi:hypothetical protein
MVGARGRDPPTVPPSRRVRATIPSDMTTEMMSVMPTGHTSLVVAAGDGPDG